MSTLKQSQGLEQPACNAAIRIRKRLAERLSLVTMGEGRSDIKHPASGGANFDDNFDKELIHMWQASAYPGLRQNF